MVSQSQTLLGQGRWDDWSALHLAIAAGAEDRVTGEAEALTGRPPIAFEDFAHAHAGAWSAQSA